MLYVADVLVVVLGGGGGPFYVMLQKQCLTRSMFIFTFHVFFRWGCSCMKSAAFSCTILFVCLVCPSIHVKHKGYDWSIVAIGIVSLGY